MARLEMSKALLLLGSGLDEEAREEIAAKAADEGATVKDLREQLRKAKLQIVQETGAGAEIREALKTLEAERKQLEQQLRAQEQAYGDKLEEQMKARSRVFQEELAAARDDAYRRGEGAGKMDAAAEIRKLKEALALNEERVKEITRDNRGLAQDLKEKEKERAAAYREGHQDAEAQAENKIFGLQNELNKQTQYAQSLREELEKKQEAAVPADFAKDREILLAAAEEAEKRAADAEAELEALKAAGAGQPDPGWKVLKKAVDIFMADCELLAINDLQGLLREEAKVNATLNYLDGWIDATRQAMAGAVQAEGAVL